MSLINFLKIAGLITLVSLTGCNKKVKIKVESMTGEQLDATTVDKIRLKAVKWKVVQRGEPGSMEELYAAINSNRAFVLSDEGYKNLMSNLGKLQKLTLQQKARIRAYQKYYERTKKGHFGTSLRPT